MDKYTLCHTYHKVVLGHYLKKVHRNLKQAQMIILSLREESSVESDTPTFSNSIHVI